MDRELKNKIETLEQLILLLRRDIDKFRVDFFEVKNKLIKLERNQKWKKSNWFKRIIKLILRKSKISQK